MQHDADGSHDLTYEEWASYSAAAGKHLRHIWTTCSRHRHAFWEGID